MLKLLQSLMGVLSLMVHGRLMVGGQCMTRMVAAFAGRAKQLYSARQSGATRPAA
jgi:hypothetical protein